MHLEKILSFLYSMHALFEQDKAVSLSSSQYDLMKEAVIEITKANNNPKEQVKLYGIIGRVGRRMKKPNELHIWPTEYESVALSMLSTLKVKEACRLDDTLADINEIYLREKSSAEKSQTNTVNPANNKRHTDKQHIVSIFG